MSNRPYPRYAFRCEAQFCPHGTDAGMAGMLSDISLSGCYIETLSPLPIGTQLDVRFVSNGISLALPGIVRVIHPSMGMGIQFINLPAEPAQRLEQLVRSQNHAN
jgi:PilZ domain